MTERKNQGDEKKADVERSSENIRQDITQEKENLSQTVDQISARIKAKLDWREYVKNSPYLAIGTAAGLGYLASRVFKSRTTPMERIMGSIAEEVRDSIGGLIAGVAGPGLIKVALLGIATKAVAGWIRKANTAETAGVNAVSRPRTGRSSTVNPRLNP